MESVQHYGVAPYQMEYIEGSQNKVEKGIPWRTVKHTTNKILISKKLAEMDEIKRKKILALRRIQNLAVMERIRLENQLFAVEETFYKKMEEIFKKRNDIITGVAVLSDIDCDEESLASASEKLPSEKNKKKRKQKKKGIKKSKNSRNNWNPNIPSTSSAHEEDIKQPQDLHHKEKIEQDSKNDEPILIEEKIVEKEHVLKKENYTNITEEETIETNVKEESSEESSFEKITGGIKEEKYDNSTEDSFEKISEEDTKPNVTVTANENLPGMTKSNNNPLFDESNYKHDHFDISSKSEKLKKEQHITLEGLPEFWLDVFKLSPIIKVAMSPADMPIIKNLEDITSFYHEGNIGFTLCFHFKPNEFFKNTILTKSYKFCYLPKRKYLTVKLGRSVEGDEIPPTLSYKKKIESKGTEIQWYEGKDTTKLVNKWKSKELGRTVYFTSFFNFFKTLPKMSSFKNKKLRKELLHVTTWDFVVGRHFIKRIIPRAGLIYSRGFEDKSEKNVEAEANNHIYQLFGLMKKQKKS